MNAVVAMLIYKQYRVLGNVKFIGTFRVPGNAKFIGQVHSGTDKKA